MSALVDDLRRCCDGAGPSGRAADAAPLARTMRVSQLDAALLDEELSAVLRSKLVHAGRHLQQGRLSPPPELAALIQAFVCACSVWTHGSTPGAALLGLQFERGAGSPAASSPLSAAQRSAFGAALLCQLLLHDVRRQPCPRPLSGQGVLQALSSTRVDDALAAASAANLLLFLNRGRYRSVAECALGACLVHARDDMSRFVSLDFLNRQLVWRELSDLLLFVLPLMNGLKLRRLAGTLTRRATGGPDSIEQTRCALCTQPMLLPCAVASCGHRCCYFCLSAGCRADAEMRCPMCSVRISALRRVS